MKKIIATVAALSMLLAFASCDDNTTATSSNDASSTTAPSVSTTPAPVISVPSVESVVSEPEIPDSLALRDGATPVDMNTGKTADDEGYVEYYDTVKILDVAFDGNYSGEGWQPKSTEESGGAYVEGDEIEEGWYVAEADGNLYKMQVWEDGALWLGVTFAEATEVDTINIVWESGSIVKTVEEGGYRLEYTTDGTEWKALEDATVTRGEADAVVVGAIADTAAFEAMEVTGVRAVILNGTTKYAPKVYEFEVFGPEEEAPAESAEDASADAESTATE